MPKRPGADPPRKGAGAPAADEDFARRLKAARQEAGLEETGAKLPPPASLAGFGLRVSSELIAGSLVGGALGWVIDKKFGTSPFGMIGLFLLGTVAGIWNAVQAVRRVNAMVPPPAPENPPTDDDEDDGPAAKLF